MWHFQSTVLFCKFVYIYKKKFWNIRYGLVLEVFQKFIQISGYNRPRGDAGSVVNSICLFDKYILKFEGNTFYNLKKYILQFEEIHFTIWKEIRGWVVSCEQHLFVCFWESRLPTLKLSTRDFIFLQIAHVNIFQEVQIFLKPPFCHLLTSGPSSLASL